MTHFGKLQLTLLFSKISQTLLKPLQNPRFRSTKIAPESAPKLRDSMFPTKAIKEAQLALLEYLHSTRSLQFLDADNMCKNSPFFLNDLLNKVQKNNLDYCGDIKKSTSRYLRYHPINEFEPFFESTGLKPFEYLHLLPRDMIFLNDDRVLMENYHILCNYGVPRKKMGNIFKVAPEIFRYRRGVLSSKLKCYEELGVASSILMKVVVLSPRVLVGNADLYFVEVVEKLKNLVGNNANDWIQGNLLDASCCNWGFMLELLCLLEKLYRKKYLLGEMISKHPCVVFEDSGCRTLSLFGFLLKLGLSIDQICLMFVELPQTGVAEFLSNLRQCLIFLCDINMKALEIGQIFRSQSLLMGSCKMKKTNTLLGELNVGKKSLRKSVQSNPEEIKNWVMGKKNRPLVNSDEENKSKGLKTEFLMSLGYEENSKEMETAFKLFRGKGDELQERFNFIVKAGLDSEDVRRMIRAAPQILNQTTDRINMKIEYLVNEGYPVSNLVNFPSFLSYTPGRVKLRLSMYNWLRDHGAAESGLALSTVIACSDKIFVQKYVKRHPSGFQVWNNLKSEISSEYS